MWRRRPYLYPGAWAVHPGRGGVSVSLGFCFFSKSAHVGTQPRLPRVALAPATQGSHVNQIGKLSGFGSGKAHFHAKRFPVSDVCLSQQHWAWGRGLTGSLPQRGPPAAPPATPPASCRAMSWCLLDVVFLPVQVICSLRAELSLVLLHCFICISLRS